MLFAHFVVVLGRLPNQEPPHQMNPEPEQEHRQIQDEPHIDIVSEPAQKLQEILDEPRHDSFFATENPGKLKLKTSGAASDDTRIGTTIGDRYVILEVVGQGGMGTVYKARHLTLSTTVAVKILCLNQSANRDKMFRRFAQEAKAASHVRHPHLTAVSDFGLTDPLTGDGSPYLVMDFVEGKSLAAELEDLGRLEPARAMAIFMQICEGMDAVHRTGIIHRDLKPSNIILEKDSAGKDFVRIVDFGIAKLAPEAIEASGQLTQTGEIFGSPLYMSPEQCLGNKVDTQSDVYSLGCLMYETLTGSPPLSGSNAVQTIFKHINDLPSEITLEQSGVPPDLSALVLQALEKQPEDRPNSMWALKLDLENIIAGRSLSKAPAQNNKKKKKKKTAGQDSKSGARSLSTVSRWGVLGLICIIVLIALPIVSIAGYRTFAQLTAPAWQVQNNMGVEQMTLGGEGNLGAAKTFFRKALEQAEAAHAADKDIENICINLGAADYRTKNFSHARPILERALTLSRKHDANLQRGGTLEMLSGCQRETGHFEKAVLEADEAVSLMRRLFGSNSQQTANALGFLAKGYKDAGKYTEAQKANREQLDIDLKLHPDKQFDGIADAYACRADIMDGMKDSNQAIDAAKTALNLYKDLEGKDGPNTQRTALWLTKHLTAQNKTVEAQKIAQDFKIDINNNGKNP